MNIAINGFGRIGRAVFKNLLDKPGIKIVAINDLTETKNLAYLLKYDSVYGIYDKSVSYTKNSLTVKGKKIPVIAEPEPAKLPWRKFKVDLVVESTGRFCKKEQAVAHLKAGAKKVAISAPAKSDDIKTIVPGVNEKSLTKSDKIFSMASCTTNCLSTVTDIIRQKIGIVNALMTTIHGYTSSQGIVDSPHKDPRRGRAAAINIVPTTTGAAIATTKAIPQLKGKFDGLAVRVPVVVGSLCDTVYLTKKKVTVDKVNKLLASYSKKTRYKGILAVTNEPLVSTDIIKNSASAIVDLSMTRVVGDNLLKIISWYDNEWAYSCRMADLCAYINKRKLF
ncbi:MAG: type I glyceraldehyde-3-phosphate dehydrogenase [bacterium]